MKHHPIQLKAIQVKKLYLEVFDKAIASAEELEVDVQFKVGSKVPEPNDDVILVNFICNVKKNEGFSLEVDIFGVFTLEGEFPRDKLEHWSNYNAPLILLPYVRENVAALCARSDLNFHLPLIEVPTFRYEN
ncbi:MULTISPECIES: protein-export chaperone SecB [Psychrobacter]|jgi:preprotein translocase subunit SecB|uniref:protein-export chaperone SecB n=1 Tax=Psychrobacter TaxID=497 RepID=UPI00086831AB|nr:MULTISPECIES: protein-export chaperone SecB [Psychrobacter]MBA6244615.1 protein-export chaperone SecB [Psychrobacter sp. Urea-trap-18]MBA6285115.1 protein-export chaperone SecB [Psychrobacter sp. Urea-trap-16]MBA6319518.1 protein-export chaperone SecB [Psychrobacter sp. Urea-trap-20]MBA6334091.1 protein-export chaperone SecB [Psychrobacter sp. Urea-trap-19]OEH67466.1 MAG: hypothetical protein BAX61_11115 [Psychrobacter sp. B29-1]|tara:strand:- start:277 stop:672 length:396 start_codon:yes stop_codon:yes gene_type:complete